MIYNHILISEHSLLPQWQQYWHACRKLEDHTTGQTTEDGVEETTTEFTKETTEETTDDITTIAQTT